MNTPWDRRIATGGHFISRSQRCCCACILSRVRLFTTPWIVARQAPWSMWMSQVRILELIAISFSRGSFWSRDWTWVSCFGRRVLYHCTTWETQSKTSFQNFLHLSGNSLNSAVHVLNPNCIISGRFHRGSSPLLLRIIQLMGSGQHVYAPVFKGISDCTQKGCLHLWTGREAKSKQATGQPVYSRQPFLSQQMQAAFPCSSPTSMCV